DVFWSSTIPVKAAVLITGGFLWGYGARLAKGCTSGNTISGISRGSLSSIVATVMFMVGGILVFQILNWLAGGKY
ncbi:MAG TPA: YeeE/YedE thiosulfate transporter family protein, partial [Leptospiraceae bacterium]|nr:YeeE/YedE thiosulfate transporter family protein [Leptospiraceae bacterium]